MTHPGERADGGEGGGRSLRVVFLDSWPREPTRGSGTAVSISTLAGGLAELGHRVESVDVPFLRRAGAAGRLVYNAALPFLLSGRAPDLAVGFDVDGCLLPRSRPFPLVVQLKGVAADEARFERGLARLGLRVLAALERRNARRAERVVVPSEYSRRVAVEAYGLEPDQVSVVPEALDPAPWEALRARELRPFCHPTILSVARQYPRKNTSALVRALPRVAQRVPDVRLRIVGGGPELRRLRHLVERLGLQDRVALPGPVADPDALREEYARAHCFCLPSLQEGFGIVFLEAMASGLPVVAGRAGAVPEVVSHDETGLLEDPADPEALASAVIRVLTEDGLADRLARAGRRRVRAFTPRAAALRFLGAVEDLLPPDAREHR